MATQYGSVGGTFTGNATSDTLYLTLGGVVVVDAQRTAGSLDVALEVSLDGGTTFAQAFGADEAALTRTVDGTNTHGRMELVVSAGQAFRLVSTNDSSSGVIYKLYRAAAL